MNNDTSKVPVNRDVTCRSHSARSDKDLYRICPSKLSKRELEDLYFALLENNLELKRTINGQKDRIKVLSAKVQRMSTIQRSTIGREQGCCATTKAVVNDQRESIAELKKANERMSERIRLLNMRLCSAKQFLKSSPVQNVNRYRTSSNATGTIKNSSMSALISKISDSNLKTNAVSSQYLDGDGNVPTYTIPENEPHVMENASEPRASSASQASNYEPEKCCENWCRTTMDEMKQKIVDLQEALSSSKEAFGLRAARLEEQLAAALADRDARLEALASQHRATSANYEDLCLQLSIEKRKVSELETRIKAENMSNKVAKTIEQHLSNINESLKLRQEYPGKVHERMSTQSYMPFYPADQSSPRTEPSVSSKLLKNIPESSPETKMSKYSDDSGYLDAQNQEFGDKDIKKMNTELMKRISYLQGQLDALKASATRESLDEAQIHSSNYENDYVEAKDTIGPIQRPNTGHSMNEGEKSTFKSAVSEEQSKGDISDKPKTVGTCDADDEASKNDEDRNTSIACKKHWDQGPSTSKDLFLPSSEEISHTNANRTGSFEQKHIGNRKSDSHNTFQIPGPIPNHDSAGSAAKRRMKQVLQAIHKADDTKGVGENVRNVLSEKTMVGNRTCIDNDFNGRTCQLIDDDSKAPQASEGNQNEAAVGNRIEIKSILTEHTDRTERDDSGTPHQVDEGEEIKKKSNKILSFEDMTQRKLRAESRESVPRDSVEISWRRTVKEGKSFEGFGGNMQKDSEKEADSLWPNKRSVDFKPDDSCQGEVEVPVNLDAAGLKQTDNPMVTVDACTTTAAPGNDDEIVVCTRCRCCPRRSLSVFRSSSGTLRFRTVPARACACAPLAHTRCLGPIMKQPPKDLQPTSGSSPTPQNTYTITPPADERKCSRATSPDDTEQEISSLTDLPSERDDKSPRMLSSGEDKATTTYTGSTVASDNRSLSLGEMPGCGAKTLTKPRYEDEHAEGSTSHKMEAALQAITEELARCKHLLSSQRSQSQAARTSVAEVGTSPTPDPMALHRARAQPSIGDTTTPSCVFTLHIGTLVLSDEAVLNSRNMTLMLTWKFYNQNVNMTRMKAGRVVLFDFSTEYDVKITDDFLRYLKYEEMPIIICEMDKIDEPFASCALPLRDALLHTNRRSDMSLALVAGPQMKRAHASDALDYGDEMGVLDMWCMLRTDPKLLPAISQSIAQSVLLPNSADHKVWKPSRLLEQELEDQPSNEFRLSTDLDQHLKDKHIKVTSATKTSHMTQKDQAILVDRLEDKNPQDADSSPHPRRKNSPVTPPNSDEMVNTRCSSTVKKSAINSLYLEPSPERSSVEIHSNYKQSFEEPSSQILINEVPANIKSAEEMKRALARNVDESNMKLPPVMGPKLDDEISQATSIGSMMKIAFAKKQFHKMKWTPKNSINGENEISREVSRQIGNFPTRRTYIEDDEDMHIADGRRAAGSVNRTEQFKKSVTIMPKHNHRSIADLPEQDTSHKGDDKLPRHEQDSLTITILWLALNEECDAMLNPRVQRLYIAYSFLGRSGAELETPVSLPKPKHYIEKCYFNFKKKFHLQDSDLPLLGHMARCRSSSRNSTNPHDCVVFTVISEPPEDPLGLESCEDIGTAQLYLGDVVASSGDSSEFTEVVAVRAAGGGAALGVLAVRLEGLPLVRRCLALSHSHYNLTAHRRS